MRRFRRTRQVSTIWSRALMPAPAAGAALGGRLRRLLGRTFGAVVGLLAATATIGLLLIAGLTCGVPIAFLSVLPALLSPGAEIPYLSLSITMLLIFLNGLLWTYFATAASLRGNLVASLRSE